MAFTRAGCFFLNEASGPVEIALLFDDQVDVGPIWIGAHPHSVPADYDGEGVAALSVHGLTKGVFSDRTAERIVQSYSISVTNVGNMAAFFSLEWRGDS